MQRFAGLNSIEGWNLTFQLSKLLKMKKNGKFLFEKGKNSDILNHINCSELRRFVSKIVGYAILTKYEAFWKLDLNRTQDE